MRFPFESLSDYMRSKIMEAAPLARAIEEIRAASSSRGKPSIVTLNGSFDLMHAGHLHILYEASQQGDILIIGVNTDSSVKRYKSPLRPIIPLQERMQMLAALSFVDFVTWFDEEDPRHFISTIRPDVHVNGVEYGLDCIEAGTVAALGAKLHLVSKIPGRSTSTIIKTIQGLPQ